MESLTVSNAILEATDSFPNHSIDLATLLRPPLIAPSNAAVNLTNVFLLHTLSASQASVAVATLRGVVSDPIVQRAIASWAVNLYTVSWTDVCLGYIKLLWLACQQVTPTKQWMLHRVQQQQRSRMADCMLAGHLWCCNVTCGLVSCPALHRCMQHQLQAVLPAPLEPVPCCSVVLCRCHLTVFAVVSDA